MINSPINPANRVTTPVPCNFRYFVAFGSQNGPLYNRAGTRSPSSEPAPRPVPCKFQCFAAIKIQMFPFVALPAPSRIPRKSANLIAFFSDFLRLSRGLNPDVLELVIIFACNHWPCRMFRTSTFCVSCDDCMQPLALPH